MAYLFLWKVPQWNGRGGFSGFHWGPRKAGSAGFAAGITLLLALAALPALPQARQRAVTAAEGSYRIAGKVVNAVTGEPLRHVTIAALTAADSLTVESAQSDEEGHFALDGLAAGKYQLTASKRGFRTAFYNEHGDFSTAIVTGEDQDTGDLTFRLTPGAVLRGAVTADGGDPVAGASVMLFQRPRHALQGTRITQVDTTITDDTGAYEFNNLAAGEYLLAVKADPWYALHHAAPGTARAGGTDLDVAYPVTYFDSTTEEASAAPIMLAGGSREQADLYLHAVPALRLRIPSPSARTTASPDLKLSIFGTQISGEAAAIPGAGMFEFEGLAPGHYELALGDPPRIVGLDATANLQVDANAGTPTAPLAGTLRTAAGGLVQEDVGLTLEPLGDGNGAHGQSQLQATAHGGRFRFDAVPPGSWALWADNSGQMLPILSIAEGGAPHPGNSVATGDRALTIAVAVSQGDTRIEGFARRDGKGVAGAMVVLVPKDPASYHALLRRDQSDSDGSFGLRDVAPGPYVVVAIEDGWELDWERPEVLARYLPHGIAVTVSDRSASVVRLSGPVPVQSR